MRQLIISKRGLLKIKMNNNNIADRKTLEREFAEDFSSPIFPILGEIYLQNKELSRAEKVCKIGLKHDPDNINGYYILAKVYLCNNELNDAEKILKILINKNPLHINALKLIVKLHDEINTSKTNQLKYLKQLFSIFPNNKDLESKICTIEEKPPSTNKSITSKPKEPVFPSKINNIIPPNINFNIQPNMATLTFVKILKEQKHYAEALQVLSVVEGKLGSNKNTKSLKKDLQKLLSESH